MLTTRSDAGARAARRLPTGGWGSFWVTLLVFVIVLFVQGLSRVSQSCDSMWSVHIGLSIMREGNTDIDEYRDAILSGPRYLYEIVDGHVYSSYPIGTPLLVAPLVYVIDLGIRQFRTPLPNSESSPTVPRHERAERAGAASSHGSVEILVASFIVALTTVLVYYVGRQFLSPLLSLLLACIFAFCTPAWSTASRALWQHGPSMLMLAAALLILLKARERPFLVQFASLPLAYSFVIRPTNALSIIALTIYVAMRYRRYLLRYLAWSLVVVVPFVWYDLWLYHSILPSYFAPSKVGAIAHLFEGLAGTLVSPSRGLFLYSPVFLLSICGMVLNLKKGKDRLLDLLLAMVIAAHWLVISSFPDWYGGHSFGPRYFADMVPYLVYFLIPVLIWFAETRGVLRGWFIAASVLLVLASFLVNLNGAVNRATQLWSVNPVNVDEARGRLWDWADPQFLRGVLRE